MINASVCILTKNSAKNLQKCLKGVKYFKEKIVCDGYSIDRTIEIAKKNNCKIVLQPRKYLYQNKKIKNFSAIRNYLLKLSKYELIFFLDSDEIASINLINEIKKITQRKYTDQNIAGYIVPRKIIRYFERKSNFQYRVFNKKRVSKFIKSVHEMPVFKRPYYTKKILDSKNVIFSYPLNWKKFKEKEDYYFHIEKNEMIFHANFLIRLRFVTIRILTIIKNIFLNKQFMKLDLFKKNLYRFYLSIKLLF